MPAFMRYSKLLETFLPAQPYGFRNTTTSLILTFLKTGFLLQYLS